MGGSGSTKKHASGWAFEGTSWNDCSSKELELIQGQSNSEPLLLTSYFSQESLTRQGSQKAGMAAMVALNAEG